MYELYDPCTVMFFYRNKHIMIDLGTGNNNKINVRRLHLFPDDSRTSNTDVVTIVGNGRQTRANRHHRNGLPWSEQRSRSGRQS
jgi:hypothetical protein